MSHLGGGEIDGKVRAKSRKVSIGSRKLLRESARNRNTGFFRGRSLAKTRATSLPSVELSHAADTLRRLVTLVETLEESRRGFARTSCVPRDDLASRAE